ncbi:Hsp70 family protein [Streptomyces luteocolor]|uniref:Hsp70 family protein n=1 Tax=Streptomyces luteocolor TaxID=285500 RepID=UPI0008539059|nr:Hsp70 family protein [Streptomyces luteocolor]
MEQAVLAIDFGTSASSAALLTDGGVRLLKERSTGSWTWPSAVCLRDDTLLIGTPAEHRKKVRPELYRAEFKRDVGQDAPIPLGERSFTPGDLVARVLAAFRDEAARLLGAPVERAVLTVPAAYGPADPRRGVMLAAGRAAGFTAVELLAEPAAAAYAPVAGAPLGPGRTVLVYDFGGGTFDAALVRLRDGGSHEVLGHDALDDCGGSDIDALLLAEIRERGGAELAAALSPAVPVAARRNVLELGDLARRLKHQLSADSFVEDVFAPAGALVELDRKRFVTIVTPLLARTVDCCRALLATAGLTADQVDAVLLVGGTTRMPVVAELLGRALDRPLRHVEDPELAVAHGAAHWATYTQERHLAPADVPRGQRPLSWALPGGTAELVRWLRPPGADYAPGQALALARPADGSLWELRSDDRPGRVVAHHAAAGQTVVAGDWLVTVGAREPAPRAEATWLPGGRVVRTVAHRANAEVVAPALSADGQWLATGASDGTACVWGPAGGGARTTVRHTEPALAVAVNGDGTLLASSSRGPGARLDRGADTVVLASAHSDWVRAVALTEDGRWFASGADDGVAHVWDVREGRRLASLRHESWVLALALSADGRLLASGDRDGTCRLWSVPERRELWSIPYGSAVNGVALSEDGGRLAVGTQSGRVHVWDVPGRDCLLVLDHTAGVNTVSLGAGGRILAVAPALWSAQVRDVDRAGRVLCEAAHPEVLVGAALSGDGRRLATTCQDGSARVWALTREDPAN